MVKNSYLSFGRNESKIPLKVVYCSEDNMKVNLFKWALRYLKVNVNGESHSQQSQKGLFVKKNFLLVMVCTCGSKIIQSFNIFTHKSINVYDYKVQQWEWLTYANCKSIFRITLISLITEGRISRLTLWGPHARGRESPVAHLSSRFGSAWWEPRSVKRLSVWYKNRILKNSNKLRAKL